MPGREIKAPQRLVDGDHFFAYSSLQNYGTVIYPLFICIFFPADVPEKKTRAKVPKSPKSPKVKKTATKAAKASGKVSKKVAKADKPKRGKSAFMFYSIENRPRVLKTNPGIAFGEVGKVLGAEWNALDAKKKEKYNKLSDADKTKAAKENAAKA